jgi:hypothetical protein
MWVCSLPPMRCLAFCRKLCSGRDTLGDGVLFVIVRIYNIWRLFDAASSSMVVRLLIVILLRVSVPCTYCIALTPNDDITRARTK